MKVVCARRDDDASSPGSPRISTMASRASAIISSLYSAAAALHALDVRRGLGTDGVGCALYGAGGLVEQFAHQGVGLAAQIERQFGLVGNDVAGIAAGDQSRDLGAVRDGRVGGGWR